MAKIARFHPQVASDIQYAARRYESISLRLGARIKVAIKSYIATIRIRPESFGRLEGERRAAMVEGFPYLVLFISTSSHVILLGVFHSASDPAKWLERSL